MDPISLALHSTSPPPHTFSCTVSYQIQLVALLLHASGAGHCAPLHGSGFTRGQPPSAGSSEVNPFTHGSTIADPEVFVML